MTFISIGGGVPECDHRMIIEYCQGFVRFGKKTKNFTYKNSLDQIVRLIIVQLSASSYLVNYLNYSTKVKRSLAVGQDSEIKKLIKGYKLTDK